MSNIQHGISKYEGNRKRMNEKEKKFDLQERFTTLIPKSQLGNAREG